MKTLHLKILLSHGFNTFFAFPKITTLFVHSHIFTHLHHCDQNKQNILPVYSNLQPPPQPPIYSGPKSIHL